MNDKPLFILCRDSFLIGALVGAFVIGLMVTPAVMIFRDMIAAPSTMAQQLGCAPDETVKLSRSQGGVSMALCVKAEP